MTHTPTPGPWKSDGVLIWAGNAVIAQADIAGVEYNEAARAANANLIASAPDLYESLKVILDGFEEGIFVRNISGDEKGDWAMRLIPFLAALGKAQAALAKAEGKS